MPHTAANFADRLNAAIVTKGTPALVGLDPRFEQLPGPVIEQARKMHHNDYEMAAYAFEEFCKRIIDVVAPLVPAVKPQAAFFEQLGPLGVMALQRVIRHARRAGLIVICDAKRGDIGSTAEAYAQAYLAGADAEAAPFGADALTVNPYLGVDTLEPFVHVARERSAGLYVLVRTSNPGASSFQDHQQGEVKLYEQVAAAIESLNREFVSPGGSAYGPIGAVVGATYPAELSQLRARMPSTPLLIPGYGAQGGGAADVAAAFDKHGLGAVVNSSRGINFAFQKQPFREQFQPEQWEQAVEQATLQMIADLAEHTPASELRDA